MTDTKTTFLRAFPTNIEQTGKGLLTGRLVPYGEAADVLDELPSGQIEVYREGFRQGAFAPQTALHYKQAGVALHHRHDARGLGYLGPFIGLRDQPDGLWGDVRVLPRMVDDVGALLESGVNELSIEFRLSKRDRGEVIDGVRWRTGAHLDGVALEAKGAYSSAQVLAYRAEVDEEERERAIAEAEAAAAAATTEEEAAAAEAERTRAAAEVEAAAERRARWDALTARLDPELERQAEYKRTYGVTDPPGFRRLTS